MKQTAGAPGQVEAYRAADGRLIGLYIPGDFTDYPSFPPFVATPEEQAHLAQAYKVISPQRERETKAHVTADELPLQIVLLNRDPGSRPVKQRRLPAARVPADIERDEGGHPRPSPPLR